MSALGGLIGASSRQRSSRRRASAWLFAVAGPALIGAASMPFRSSFGLAGGLFVMMLVVAVVAIGGGVRAGLVAVGASVLSGLYFLAPPDNSFAAHRIGDVLALIAFSIVGTAVAALVNELALLGEEQALSRRIEAALRRVATLVAAGPPSEELFAVVTEEVGQLLPVDFAIMGRYEPDGMISCVATWGSPVGRFPVGSRSRLAGDNLVTIVHETGRSARVDGFEHASGAVGIAGRESGFRSTVGTPIVVEGQLWGVMTVGSTRLEPTLPAWSEARLAQFTALLATAVANAEGRARLARLAEEQAALRRVATLVAQGMPPEEVFAAVIEEVGRLLPVDLASMGRYETDGALCFVAAWGGARELFPPGSRAMLGGRNLGTLVFETGRPSRIDGYADSSTGPLGLGAHEAGIRSAVATPIMVEGQLWGVIAAGATGEEPLPPDTELRLADFTGLLATAIANAENRAEITASRARIVAAADDTRRRIERDLHDGAQQRLVSLGLELRAAQAEVPPALGELGKELSSVADGLAGVQDELREFARGIHPAILAEGGLGAALRTLARRSAVAVELAVQEHERLPERVEVAAYYVVSEALTNAAKHAHASVIHVNLQSGDGPLRLRVRDDGDGGADPSRGSGLIGLKDRVEALGGKMTVDSPPGVGTCLDVELPVGV
ncbi:MAG TPA: GAF domain-containing protein [Solirubrobacteraceae bacterium]|nr:GAF domain-containing protein [Solirubrobacteraceae bacterium]